MSNLTKTPRTGTGDVRESKRRCMSVLTNDPPTPCRRRGLESWQAGSSGRVGVGKSKWFATAPVGRSSLGNSYPNGLSSFPFSAAVACNNRELQQATRYENHQR